MKKKFSVQALAEIAIFAAIAFVLDFIQGAYSKGLFPNGGSIGVACVPVLVISYRRGLLCGILCGLLLSLVQMIGGIYVIQGSELNGGFMQTMGPFIQVMLDYVLGYTVVGLAGLFMNKYQQGETIGKKILYICLGTIVGVMAKYLCHVLSGLLFWPGEIFGISGWAYSFVYNGLYCIPCLVLSMIVMILFARFYSKILKVDNK